ncbi:hypothetical protein SADUNF_Sadunf10G0093300 [Salix dunnii]|uniref:Uncharacterized protein n=1 Tax=Salix dunnii TaxID=1413687 RepID=A0A835MPG3_9ROSI|nr:hypothetical protein SADUNF_Sadunf10G0093300 [Salix dunnii]
MAEEAAKAMEPNANMLKWPKKDKHRLLQLCTVPVYLTVHVSLLIFMHLLTSTGFVGSVGFIIDFYMFVNFNWVTANVLWSLFQLLEQRGCRKEFCLALYKRRLWALTREINWAWAWSLDFLILYRGWATAS